MFYRLICYDTLLRIDPAVNQERVMGLEADLLLCLANDLEGNRGCQCLQHVLL